MRPASNGGLPPGSGWGEVPGTGESGAKRADAMGVASGQGGQPVPGFADRGGRWIWWLGVTLVVAAVFWAADRDRLAMRQEARDEAEDRLWRDLQVTVRSLSVGHQVARSLGQFTTALRRSLDRAGRDGDRGLHRVAVARQAAQAFSRWVHGRIPAGIEVALVEAPRFPKAAVAPRFEQMEAGQVTLVGRFGAKCGLASLAEDLGRYLVTADPEWGQLSVVPWESGATATLPLQRAVIDRFGLPLPVISLFERGAGHLTEFTTQETVPGFYWDRIRLPSADDRCLLIFALVDRQRLPVDLVARALRSHWGRPHPGLAIIDRHGRNAWFSPRWRRHPAARRQVLADAHSDRVIAAHRGAGWVAVSFCPSPGAQARLAWLATVATTDSHGDGIRYLALLVIGAAIVLAAIRAEWFGGLSRVSLSLRMIAAFLLAVLMPLTVCHAVANEIFRRRLRQETIAARTALREQMLQVDQGIAWQYERTTRELARFTKSVAIRRRLDRAQAAWRAGDREPIRRLGRAIFTGVIRRLSTQDGLSRESVRQLSIAGDDGMYTVQFLVDRGEAESPVVNDFFASVSNRVLRLHNSGISQMVSGSPTRQLLIDDVFNKLVRSMFLALGGTDQYFDLLFTAGRVIEICAGGARTSMLLEPIGAVGAPGYLFLWTWESGAQADGPYLQERLQRLNRRPGGGQFFAMHTVGGRPIPSEGGAWSKLRPVMNRCREIWAPVTGFDPQEGGWLLEAVPCRNMNAFVMGGALPYGPLVAAQHRLQWGFRAAMAGMLAVAVLMAVGAAGVFVVPIRTLSEGLREIGAGRFETRLALAGGQEFEALARQFNRMARELEEGRVLGSFVSESARQAARSGNLEALAGEARNTEATVLFCSLAGFDERRQELPPAVLLGHLDRHLGRVALAVRRQRGEIDKMIGDKIMVVIDHQRLGSPYRAAAAAVQLAWEVVIGARRAGDAAVLPPAIGVNTGPVLAGILGAPAVRLDYTVIGDTVNLAARLAVLAQTVDGSRIVLSGQTLRLAPEGTRAERLPFRRVKGKSREVEVYQLEG